MTLIDAPVGPYSTPAEIRAWIAELAKLPQDEIEVQEAIAEARRWLIPLERKRKARTRIFPAVGHAAGSSTASARGAAIVPATATSISRSRQALEALRDLHAKKTNERVERARKKAAERRQERNIDARNEQVRTVAAAEKQKGVRGYLTRTSARFPGLGLDSVKKILGKSKRGN